MPDTRDFPDAPMLSQIRQESDSMDRPLTIKTGVIVGALCGGLLALAVFIASGVLRQVEDLGSRISKNEGSINLVMDRERDIRERLQRIEDKVDRLTEKAPLWQPQSRDRSR